LFEARSSRSWGLEVLFQEPRRRHSGRCRAPGSSGSSAGGAKCPHRGFGASTGRTSSSAPAHSRRREAPSRTDLGVERRATRWGNGRIEVPRVPAATSLATIGRSKSRIREVVDWSPSTIESHQGEQESAREPSLRVFRRCPHQDRHFSRIQRRQGPAGEGRSMSYPSGLGLQSTGDGAVSGAPERVPQPCRCPRNGALRGRNGGAVRLRRCAEGHCRSGEVDKPIIGPGSSAPSPPGDSGAENRRLRSVTFRASPHNQSDAKEGRATVRSWRARAARRTRLAGRDGNHQESGKTGGGPSSDRALLDR